MNRAAIAMCLTALLLACDDDKKAAPSAAANAAPEPSAPAAPAAPEPSASVAPPKPPPNAVAAQHVLVAYKGAKNAPRTVARSKTDAKALAEEVATKAKAGADFTALVAELSDDAGSKDRMGSVGKFTRDKMVKAFSDAAFALEVDEISDVVETEFGFHVIKRNQ